jgi:hypothetical protein
MNSKRSPGRTRIEFVVAADVREVAVLAELVDGPCTDRELLGYLGDPT